MTIWTPGKNAIYVDNGNRITTHSMLSTYRRCHKQAQYKYHERLKLKRISAKHLPLKRGVWFHDLLEHYYRGDDWRARHAELCVAYDQLFDEEKEALGDLPAEIMRMMRSYLWHYGANKEDRFHGWKIIDTELTFECPWPDSPDGSDLYRCRVDVLGSDEFGMLIIDHKTHKTLPDHTQRVVDAASPLYIWAARENGYDVRGFLWNYIRTKAPSIPALVDVNRNPRLSRTAVDTDYPTLITAIRDYGLDPKDYKDQLRHLHSQRWAEGKTQTSSFFRRDILEKDDAMIARVVGTAMRTRDRMHTEYADDVETVERSPDMFCARRCDFHAVCTTELFQGDARIIRRQQFRVGDPLDYYKDERVTADSD